MNEMNNRVTLTVGGMEYGGWKSVEISADLERQFRTFKLNITWQWPGQTVDQRIKPGDACEVRIGKDLVLTGYVFKAPISYDGRQISRASKAVLTLRIWWIAPRPIVRISGTASRC